jgi:methionyl-tRNA formyltransferase
VGKRCREWAKRNLPKGFKYSNDPKADVFISVLYDTIIKEDFISKRRCYNFHPGILPQQRGSGICSWVLINNEKEMGITLHKIDKGIDSGDVIHIHKFAVQPEDTANSLFMKAESIIFQMFMDWFHDLLNERYVATPQDESKAKIYYRRDLERFADITRIIKAFHFIGKPPCYYITMGGIRKEIKYEAN